jgi:hypothetical protein
MMSGKTGLKTKTAFGSFVCWKQFCLFEPEYSWI